MTGILAIWNDCAPDGLDHYERWYNREHLQERVATPGFRSGRRYEALAADRRYFTFYEVDAPDVLSAPAYLHRLEHPTAWTRLAMASFRGMVRTVCEVAHSAGGLTGAFAVTLRLDGVVPDGARAFADAIGEEDGIARVQVWAAAARQTPEGMREMKARAEPDGMVAGALVVECLRFADATRLAARLAREAPARLGPAAGGPVGTYAFLCSHDGPAR